jgi:hypothetical protein
MRKCNFHFVELLSMLSKIWKNQVIIMCSWHTYARLTNIKYTHARVFVGLCGYVRSWTLISTPPPVNFSQIKHCSDVNEALTSRQRQRPRQTVRDRGEAEAAAIFSRQGVCFSRQGTSSSRQGTVFAK